MLLPDAEFEGDCRISTVVEVENALQPLVAAIE